MTTLREYTMRWIGLFTDLSLPAVPPRAPEATLRKFVWVRVHDFGGLNPVYPAILYGDLVGPKLEYIGDIHLITPEQYHLTISELAAIYPAPEVREA
jgi:hypothetical protein